MAQGFQTIKYPLPSLTYAASGSSVIRLRDLPGMLLGRIAHVVGFVFEVQATPTLTTAPTLVGQNAIFNRIELFDGQQVRFAGDGNALRMFERIEHGRHPTAHAPTANGTGNGVYWSRFLPIGPANFAGAPTDFALPCAYLENGEIRVRWGALTDFSADTTAMTATVTVTALIALLDEIRIPPMYERVVYTTASDTPITGRALYNAVAACNSSSYDAFVAGDLGAVTIDTGSGQVVPGVDAEVLARCFNSEFGVGSLDGASGEPRAATYDAYNYAIKDPTDITGATQLLAQALDFNPMLWSPPGAKISKIAAMVESSMRVRWNGTQTGATTVLLIGRFLPQSPTVIATIADKAARALNIKSGSLKLKTLSKAPYAGPMVEFMPYALKVGKRS